MDFLTALDNYNVFYEVAKCKNITKASAILFISQPAVSQSIKKLEENLGLILFVRTKKGMELTTTGKKIFDKVEIAIKSLSLAEDLICEEKGLMRGELCIGSGSNVARKVLCTPVAQFTKDYPNIKINIMESVQSKMIEQLNNGELQFVITQKNTSINFPFKPLFDTQYCFIKSKNSDCEKFILITEGSYIHDLFKKFIEENNLQNIPTMYVAGYKIALELVELGVGTTLVPEYLVEDILKSDKFELVYKNYKLPKITFGFYYNPILITPASKVFLSYLETN